MPSREELIAQLVRQWMVKAKADLKAAESLAGLEDELWSIVAFHCQQAAEKLIKGALTREQIEFGKSHDIAELLDRLVPVKPDLAADLRPAATLTVYGVQVRYPGDAPEVDREEAEQALELARMVAEKLSDFS